MHAHSMVSVWPNMNAGGKNHTEFFDDRIIFCMIMRLMMLLMKKREKCTGNRRQEGLFDQGFDSWWCDSTEPFSGPDWSGAAKERALGNDIELVGGEHKKYLDPAVANAFALEHAKGIYENQRKDYGRETRVLNLTRSGYASGQKYSAMLWSGDTCAAWDNLKITDRGRPEYGTERLSLLDTWISAPSSQLLISGRTVDAAATQIRSRNGSGRANITRV